MSEKEGQTEKLIYDFNTANCCEVQLPNEEWYRVTPREFRSSSRPRRILKKQEYEEYIGPIYYYGTNQKVKDNQIYKIGLLFINEIDTRNSSTNKKYGRI
jgi:hypothetical protein